jgi:glucose/mannose-6-phosphate isomerase
MVFQDLSHWPAKLKEGLVLSAQFHALYKHDIPSSINKYAFIGMGGSGIAGRILKTFLDKQKGMMSFVIDSPELPAFIDEKTLAIAISYSGNTWETLDALDQLRERKVPTIIITHGGVALARAQEHRIPHILMPQAVSPRGALGYFLGFMLGLFDLLANLPGKSLIEAFCKHADQYIPTFLNHTYFEGFCSIAYQHDFFHVWGVSGESAAFAYRAQTQFNENSKVQAVHSQIPELCHNLIVGFTDVSQSPLIILFHTEFLPKHLKIAVDSLAEILQEKGAKLYKPPILGNTFEEQLFNIILWSDFASSYLGQKRGVEIVPVRLIDELKVKHKQKGIKS